MPSSDISAVWVPDWTTLPWSSTTTRLAPITVDRDNDKNPVVALREIADTMVSPEDLKEDLIHSLQAHVEVDEPEPEAAPALPSARPVNVLGPDDQFSDAMIDRITEEELLQGLARSIPAEAASGGRAKG